MKTIDVTVVSSTQTKEMNYLTKVKFSANRTVATPLGDVVQKSEGFLYLFTQIVNAVGKTATLDLDLFDIVKRETIIVDGKHVSVPENYNEAVHGTIYVMKFLYPKK